MRVASLIAVIASTGALAQAPPYERSDVIAVDSVSADELYRRAERWFVDAFADAQEVIQLRDTLTNTLVGKGRESVAGNTFTYSVEVQARDGRCRVRVYNAFFAGTYPIISHPCCYSDCSYSSKPIGKKLLEQHLGVCASILANLDAIIPSVRAALAKPSQDDW